MDFKEKIAELRAQKNDLLAKAEELVSAGKYEEADAVTGQMTGINNSIRSLESLAEGRPRGRRQKRRRQAEKRPGIGKAVYKPGRAAGGYLQLPQKPR